jgi:hypothetical protein
VSNLVTSEEQPSGSVWERLHRNQARNMTVFAELGLRAENTLAVTCPACRAEEKALFWSTVRSDGNTLHLLCPVCERAQVRYSITDNRPVNPRGTRGGVGVGIGVIAALIMITSLVYFRNSPQVRMLADDLYSVPGTMLSRARSASGDMAGDDSLAPPSARPAPTVSRSARGESALAGAARVQPSGRTSPLRTTSAPGGAGTSPGAPTAPAPVLIEESVDSARGSPVLVFVSRGDRRADVDIYAARIIDRLGEPEMRLLLQLEYDPELDVTRVVVDDRSSEWPRRLTWLRGWRRADR